MQYLQVEALRRFLKAMTILDIIVLPREQAWLRVVSVNREGTGYKFYIDNGAGDHLTVWITQNGALIKGFDHENELNQFAADEWDAGFFEHIYAGVPPELLSLMNEEEREEATFCLWCSDHSDEWRQNETGNNDGGMNYLLLFINQTAESWCDWASTYYSKMKTFDIDVVKSIYQEIPVTAAAAKKLNPDCDTAEVFREISELGF